MKQLTLGPKVRENLSNRAPDNVKNLTGLLILSHSIQDWQNFFSRIYYIIATFFGLNDLIYLSLSFGDTEVGIADHTFHII